MSYERSASVYDAIYTSMKDYRREAQLLHDMIQGLVKSPGNALLDVACGTGLHDQYLKQWYAVEGLDISSAQLAIARRRLPELTFHEDDMTTFNLGRRFDAVTCLFSAIGHLDFIRFPVAIANMARHLVPGGVLVVEPWLLPHMWRPGHYGADFVDLPDLKVARFSRSCRDGNVTTLELAHMVGRPEGVEHFVETHDLTMASEDDYAAAFAAAGLSIIRDETGLSRNGRGLFIGLKPTA